METFRTLMGAAGLAVALAAAGPAVAEYPEKPVTYIIPFGPGGESDITARMQQEFWPKHANDEEVVIQYKPGGGGSQAWSQLNSMASDGYTIMGANVPHTILQPMIADSGYQTDDVNVVHYFHYTPDAVVVPKDSEFQTLQDLIDHAKENPGAVTFAGSGSNSANHLMQQQLDKLAGITTTYVPFKGTGAAVQAIMGNQTTAGATYSTVGVNYPETRVLAVAAEERLPSLPDVPTFQELGLDWVGGAYRGVAVPAGVSEDIKQQVSDIVSDINADPAFRQKMEDGGFVLTAIDLEKMPAFLEEQKAKYRGIAEEMGLVEPQTAGSE
ncbi:Tricarboxylate transport protein TctC [Caenispirillum salinarum AK4]|uniref:Tricarboxylate transport protein TctC n=1 Tax=Caenispirillum salinarum AK4 TaxID=1238182 RepID=K9GWA0_9PROT|nr:tripartite tricarboxylate transporter substrate binding protein [Caenispirillum salinarum]EKV29527.1 Tricarboxylate transport protein TctC [Caenispirillum salinarum AK4]